MAADITVRARSVPATRRAAPSFGLSWRIMGLVVAGVMIAEVLLFLPSIGRFRMAYLNQLIESGTLAALALDATPDNMVTEEVKRTLHNIAPTPQMPTFDLTERGALGLIWDALETMARDGAYYIRIGGVSNRLPNAKVWIVVDELPMRIAMYGYAGRMLVLSTIVALFAATLLYLSLRWLVIRPLQHLSEDMTAFRRAP